MRNGKHVPLVLPVLQTYEERLVYWWERTVKMSLAAAANRSLSRVPPQEEIVRWSVEDPSEFRPTLLLDDMGKEAERFRTFYDVVTNITG